MFTLKSLDIKLAFASCALFLMVACNKSMAPLRQAPPENFEAITLAVGETQALPDPQVNILFVVDNSGSMKPHQDTLERNIGAFADKFLKNPRIDYKIGVVPVYDRKFKDGEVGACRDKQQPRRMNPLGELVPLKNSDGTPMNTSPYITRDTPNAKDVLKKTVSIGVQCGPEAEESFSPVIEVISNEVLNQTKNGGFYDKDAYLVVIFLTDADDVTPEMTAFQFYDKLVAAKGGDNSKVLIAGAFANPQKKSATCPIDGDGPVYKFPDLIAQSGGLNADLCSNSFGDRLAKLGENLVERVGTQYFKLGFIPDTHIEVSYGTEDMKLEERQKIVRNSNGGFLYNPEEQTVIIPSDLAIQRIEGGRIFVTATPVNVRNYKNGRLKMIGTSNETKHPSKTTLKK